MAIILGDRGRSTSLAPHRPLRLPILSLAAAVFGTLPATSHARSIDCSRTRSAMEKAICSDRDLSTLDEELTHKYDAAMKQLSAEGQRTLREGQRRWVRYIDEVCFRLKNRDGGADCLAELYRDRHEDLETAAVRVGPFLFTRIDYFYAFDDPEYGDPFHGQTSYPHIDHATSEATKAWNSIAAPTSRAVSQLYCDGPGDVFVRFRVVSASAAAISVESSNSSYCHGTPHPHGVTVGRTHLLKPTVRPLRAEDLFDGSTAWKALLTDRCYDALAKQAPSVLTESYRPSLRSVVTEPRAWALAEQGLVVFIGAETVLAYGQGSTVVTIPWEELRPFLTPTAPIPE